MDYVIHSFLGLKGTGKDTLAKEVRNYFSNYDEVIVCNIKNADYLRTVCSQIFGIPKEDLADPLKKDTYKINNMTYRELQIQVGTCLRSIDSSIFIKKAMHTMQQVIDYYESSDVFIIFLITDIRFQNEYRAFTNIGSKVIDLKRDSLYSLEKRIVEKLGHNFLSKLLLVFINNSITICSEWNYFKLRKKANYTLDIEKDYYVEEYINFLLKDASSYIRRRCGIK